MNVLVWLVVGFALLGAGFAAGAKVTANARDAKELLAAQAHTAWVERKQEQVDALADALEKARHARQTNTRVVTKFVDKIVARPVYSSDCLDTDGLRAANAALAGTPIDTAELDARVRAAGTTH